MTSIIKTNRDIISRSEKATIFEIILNDDVSDGVKDKLNVVGVSGACAVGVDLLRLSTLVQPLELGLDEGQRLVIVISSPVIASRVQNIFSLFLYKLNKHFQFISLQKVVDRKCSKAVWNLSVYSFSKSDLVSAWKLFHDFVWPMQSFSTKAHF